jgi:tetratricopeptide (TPR) repeat protein
MIEGVNNPFQPLALAQLAVQYAKAGQMEQTTQVLNQAINLAQAQTDASNRTLMLIGIAAYLEVGDQPQLVPPVLEQALVSTQAIPAASSGEQAGSKSNHMLRIARQLAAVGHKQQALKVLQQALPIVQAIPATPFPMERAHQLVEMANLYSALAQETQARQTLALAQTAAQTIQDPQLQEYAFVRLAEGYAVSNQFQQARQIASAIQSVNEREAAFRQIALAYLRAGQEEQALQLARSIGGQEATFSQIARYYLEQGQTDRALQLVQKQRVKGILSEVVLGYLKVGQPQQALQAAKLDTSSESGLDWLYPEIAGGFAQGDDVEQALTIARGLQTPIYRVQALLQIAEELTAREQTQNKPLHRIAVWLSNPRKLLFPRSGQSRAAAILDEALTLAEPVTASP